MRELTPEMVGFEVYYRAEVLGLEFFCLELFFIGNKYISIFVYLTAYYDNFLTTFNTLKKLMVDGS